MKYCTSCGKELSDRAKFCTACGKKCSEDPVEQPIQVPEEPAQTEGLHHIDSSCQEPISEVMPREETHREDTIPQAKAEQQDSPKEPPKKEKKSPSRKKVILFCVLGLVLAIVIAVGGLIFQWYNSTEQQILRALDAGNYDTAVVIIEEDSSASESETLADQLRERISSIKTGFVDGTVEYASAKKELDAIKRLRINSVSSELNAVQTYVDNLNESRTNFATAESFFSTGDYAEAILNYRLVIEDDVNYTVATEKLTDAINKYRDEILVKATEYASSELYTDAIALLNEALEIIPNDTKITEQIRIYEKNNVEKLKADALNTAADYAKNGDYLNAFKALNGVMKSQAADAELVSAYNKYCDQYVAQIIDEVDEKVVGKDFEGAISSLNTALKNLPNNEALVSRMEDVKAKQPVPITALLAVNTSYWGEWNSGTPTDPFGNDYSSACNYVIFRGSLLGIGSDMDHYAEYRLYGNYTTLTGTIATHIDCPENKINRLQIYSDNELVYTSDDLGRKTDAINFSVDVGGVEYVKIVVYTDSGAYAILSNVQLWP